MTPKQAFEKAIGYIGGLRATARALGASKTNVAHWLDDKEKAKPEWVPVLEAETDGVVTRHQLRPDLYERCSACERRARTRRKQSV